MTDHLNPHQPDDGAHWDPQSQRWVWGPAPAPDAGQPATPPPVPPAAPPRSPLPATPPHTAPGYHEPWPPMPPVPTPPPPPPPPPPGGQQWRTPVLVGLAAAVVGGAAVAAWMLLGGEEGGGKTARPSASAPGRPTAPEPGSSSPGPSSPVSPSPSETPSPSAGAGYTVVRNENGFSVAVPTGWQPSLDETGNGYFYRRPGDRSALLQIFRVTESASTGPCALLEISSDQLDAGTSGYRKVSVEPAGGSGCELVYEYDSAESNGRRRGVERIVTASDGKRWALLAAGPAADAATTRANLTAALDSFRPG